MRSVAGDRISVSEFFVHVIKFAIFRFPLSENDFWFSGEGIVPLIETESFAGTSTFKSLKSLPLNAVSISYLEKICAVSGAD